MTDDVHSAAAAYAIGGLPADEVEAYEAHLATCPECQAEVADIREVAVALSRSVAEEPPPTLRSSVLSAIAVTPQESAADQVTPVAGRHLAPEPVRPAAEVTSDGDAPTNVVDLGRSRPSKATALVAAAAVIVAVGFGGWALHERNTARDEAQASQAQTDSLQAQTELLAQLIAAPDSQRSSAQVTGGGAAAVVRSPSVGAAMLVAADLSGLPAGKTYEAWTIEGKQATPAGTFQSGGTQTLVQLTPAAVDAGTVAVTVEPAGGSDQPTTTPIVAISLT